MIVSTVTPSLPFFLIPVIMIAYALLSTLGGLYQVSVRRRHRQYKLVESGKLSRINRRWTLSLIALFLGSLLSSLFFVLDSPKWDKPEWILNWLAIPSFFIVFEGMKWYLSKELKPWYLKSVAMKWSFWIVAALLCILYAVIGLQPTESYSTLAQAVQDAKDPFESASSGLISDLSYASTFFDGLTAFGVSKFASEFNGGAVVVFIFRFIAYAAVVFGLVSQFNFCLLSKQEVEREFRLLPDTDREHERTPYVKRYFVILALLSAVWIAVFCLGERASAIAEESQEMSSLKTQIEQCRNTIIEEVDKEANLKGRQEEYADDLFGAQEALVNAYFDSSSDVIDSYVNWYYDANGDIVEQIKRLILKITADEAKKHFENMISDYSSNFFKSDIGEDLQSAVQDNAKGLALTWMGANFSTEEFDDHVAELSDSGFLNLWPDLNNEEMFPADYFVPAEGESREDFTERLKSSVNENRRRALDALEEQRNQLEGLISQ